MLSRLFKIMALGAVAAGTRRLWKRRQARGGRAPEESKADGRSWWERLPIKRWLKEAAAILVVFAIGGFLLAASGIIPIKASSGHWSITKWFLSFSMERSVETHTIGMKAPPLDDPALVVKGAGYYETGCRPCHGSPELPRPRVASQMTVEPPYLPPEIKKWEAEELFYIVKHGIKFTGMPAWPARDRDDEVWAMVAFLLELPELDAEEYHLLAEGETPERGERAPMHGLLSPQDVPAAVPQSCARCHGADGLGRGTGAFPRLAGQKPGYMLAALRAYARGERHSGIMEPIAAGLDEKEAEELALYYSRQDPALPVLPDTFDLRAIEVGERIAQWGLSSHRVPSCADCHGPTPIRRNPFYPELAGQYADYLVLQLELFKKGHRGGSPYAHLMHPVVDRLEPEQMRAVASYYASLRPEADSLAR